MNNVYIEKSVKKVSNRIRIREKIDFKKFLIHASFIIILIIATSAMAIADESVLNQSFSNSESGISSELTPQGHVEDFSWIKRVSNDGVIEISGIGFSVVNDGKKKHAFEICTIVQGPSEIFTPSMDSPLACTITDKIKSNGKIINQIIDFPKGVKISDLVDISITVQELK